MHLACQYCQSADLAEHCIGRDVVHGLTSESFQYYRCRGCGSIFRQVFSSERLDLYYPVDYGPYEQAPSSTKKATPSLDDSNRLRGTDPAVSQPISQEEKATYFVSDQEKPVRKRRKSLTSFLMSTLNWKAAIKESAKRRSSRLQQRLNRGQDDVISVAASFLTLGSKVCDYGCGNTQFLKKLQARVTTMKGTGVDIVTHAIDSFEHAGLTFLTTEEFWQATERYDMINMNHVLEHIPDPAQLLQRFTTKLEPHGILLITTPNARSPWALLYRTGWFALECPRHINIPTLQSLEAVAKRSGFIVMRSQVQFRYSDFARSFFQRTSLDCNVSLQQIRQHIHDHSKGNKQRLANQGMRGSLLELLKIQTWAICSAALKPFGFSDRIIIALSPAHEQD